jgi:uncharacterized damage-inducible protein DinB
MAHLLVDQLRFARSELMRCLEGVSSADARRRLYPMNCISWILGHLANQENRYWVMVAQNESLYPWLNDMVGYGKPASTPELDDMMAAWQAITKVADVFLETLTPETLQIYLQWKGKPVDETTGTLLLRNVFHYWYHIGEAMAIRQQLGHTDLPEFVGDINQAPYHPEI